MEKLTNIFKIYTYLECVDNFVENKVSNMVCEVEDDFPQNYQTPVIDSITDFKQNILRGPFCKRCRNSTGRVGMNMCYSCLVYIAYTEKINFKRFRLINHNEELRKCLDLIIETEKGNKLVDNDKIKFVDDVIEKNKSFLEIIKCLKK